MHKLGAWMLMHWVPILEYSLVFHLMSKGWLGFVFNSMEDAEKILAPKGMWDSSHLTLRPWSPLFYPATERFHVNPIWVKLPI